MFGSVLVNWLIQTGWCQGVDGSHDQLKWPISWIILCIVPCRLNRFYFLFIVTFWQIKEIIPQDYLTIIKKPMDFGTIKKMIETCSYTDAEEALQDCQQVFDNCFLYNKPQDVSWKYSIYCSDSVQFYLQLCTWRNVQLKNTLECADMG